MKYKKKICPQCSDGKEKPSIGGLCNYHYWKFRNTINLKKKKKKGISERTLFINIFNSRPKKCFLTHKPLPADLTPNTPNFHWYFHHVLPKGLYPSFVMMPKNIVIVFPDVHYDIENLPEEKLLERYPLYIELLNLKEELKEMYNARIL